MGSRAPFPKGGTPPYWWAGYEPTFDWLRDLEQRLAWLYGDPKARFAAGASDIEAWRQLGRKTP